MEHVDGQPPGGLRYALINSPLKRALRARLAVNASAGTSCHATHPAQFRRLPPNEEFASRQQVLKVPVVYLPRDPILIKEGMNP